MACPDLPIRDVRARLFHVPISEPIEMSFSRLAGRSMLLVEVETSDGDIGNGESWVNYPPWAGTERLATMREGLAPLVTGQDAARVGELHERLVDALSPLGVQWGAPGPIMQAISGVDLAAWDVTARRLGVGIASLLGGRLRDSVPIYASSLGRDRAGAMAAQCLDQGFTAVKLKVGFGTDVDGRNLGEVRKALGDDADLMVDANQAWTLEEAIAMAPLLIEHRTAWVEEPIRGGDLADLERFHDVTGLKVAVGENLYGRRNFRRHLRSPAVHVIQPDVTKVGGLTEALAICDLAGTTGKQVIPHVYGGAVALLATLQLAAARPEITQVEYDIRDNPLRDPVMIDPPAPVDTSLPIPAGPGLGCALSTESLGRWETTADTPR